MIKIYYLEQNGIPFYVGKSKDPTRRKYAHKFKYGELKLYIIDEINEFEWKYWECYWIEQFKQWGFKLKNQNKGGGGPEIYSEESKSKMRKPKPPGTGNKISKALREGNHTQYYTESVKEKMSIAQKGISKPFSSIHVKNMGKAKLKDAFNILQYSLDDVLLNKFLGLRAAKEWIISNNPNASVNVDKQIKDCCKGRQKTCYNFKWKYE